MQILINLLVLLSILSINDHDLKKWEVFESREGNFAILAPGEFELKEKTTTTGAIKSPVGCADSTVDNFARKLKIFYPNSLLIKIAKKPLLKAVDLSLPILTSINLSSIASSVKNWPFF